MTDTAISTMGRLAQRLAFARLALLSAGALLLVAADSPPARDEYPGALPSDEILAPIAPAEAAAASAALAATTPPEVSAAAAALAAAVAASDEVTARPATLTTLVADMADSDLAADREQRCLAEAVYFESRGEPLEGQLAVAQAIINRVESGRFAPTVCGVVAQPGQFSFNRNAARGGRDWTIAQAIAAVAMRDLWHEMAPRAMSFHAVRVSPGWRDRTRVATIGRHVFYR